jgi:hypothetical protein
MKSLIVATALALAFLPTAHAQDQTLPEYGDQSELKEKHKVYVAADDPDSRKLILGVLKKYDGLTVVTSPDDAEFVLAYEVKASTENRGLQTSHYMRSQMMAYTLTEKGRKRLLWSENETWDERGGLTFTRPNEYNLTNHFVHLMKKLRGEKK